MQYNSRDWVLVSRVAWTDDGELTPPNNEHDWHFVQHVAGRDGQYDPVLGTWSRDTAAHVIWARKREPGDV